MPLNKQITNIDVMGTQLVSRNNYKSKRNWKQRLQKRVIYTPRSRDLSKESLRNCRWIFNFGNSIFTIPRSIFVTALFTTRFILNLKRVIRKKDKTLRKYWITVRVLFKLSKQSKGARMGKGKGKNLINLQKYPAWRNFLEFKGVRFGRLLKFIKFFSNRFPLDLFLITHWTLTVLNNRTNFFRNA